MLASVAKREGTLCYQGRLQLGGAADFVRVSAASGCVGASKGTVLCSCCSVFCVHLYL